MKKYKVYIEEHVVECVEIEANSIFEARDIAERKYKKGEIVLEPGNVNNKLIALETIDKKEAIDWIEF